MPGPLLIATLGLALVGGLLLVVAIVALRRRQWLGSTAGLLLAGLCLALAALAGTLSLSLQGYRALTREEIAATVTVDPVAPGRFRATFRFSDGTVASYELLGDAISVEAHIVKWQPLANLLGLHTAYQLDRVVGRWDAVRDEQTRPKTVYPLAPGRTVDLVDVLRRLPMLAPIVDAEYGSATFVSTRERADLEVRVSTSGLLFRRLPAQPAAPEAPR